MSTFTAPLEIQETGRKDRWGYPIYRTAREFTYHVGCLDSDEWITVPKGTETNLASIPPGFRWFFPELVKPGGKFVQCAVLHDYMVSEFEITSLYSRKEARAVFDESLQVMGYNDFKRWVIIKATLAWDIRRVGIRRAI